MNHLQVRSIICWCDLNKITYGSDDDEGYSITCIICWCDQSSAGAISIRSHLVWMTMKVTRSYASSAGASDQSSVGAISITCNSDVQFLLCRRFLLNKITYGLDDDEGYSITCIICWCDQSSAGAISITYGSDVQDLIVLICYYHDHCWCERITAGASDQSSAGAISITYGSDVQISLC